MAKKLFIRTFGCQMNEYDSDKMADVLAASEEIVKTDSPDDADIILFNTCSVREKAQERVFHDLGRVRLLKKEKPDLIILDPPRDGIHPKALDKIINYQVDRIVYISCKPTSLARDLEILLQRGYRVEKVCPVNQFPWTVHVECVTLMSRAKE